MKVSPTVSKFVHLGHIYKGPSTVSGTNTQEGSLMQTAGLENHQEMIMTEKSPQGGRRVTQAKI